MKGKTGEIVVFDSIFLTVKLLPWVTCSGFIIGGHISSYQAIKLSSQQAIKGITANALKTP